MIVVVKMVVLGCSDEYAAVESGHADTASAMTAAAGIGNDDINEEE